MVIVLKARNENGEKKCFIMERPRASSKVAAVCM